MRIEHREWLNKNMNRVNEVFELSSYDLKQEVNVYESFIKKIARTPPHHDFVKQNLGGCNSQISLTQKKNLTLLGTDVCLA